MLAGGPSLISPTLISPTNNVCHFAYSTNQACMATSLYQGLKENEQGVNCTYLYQEKPLILDSIWNLYLEGMYDWHGRLKHPSYRGYRSSRPTMKRLGWLAATLYQCIRERLHKDKQSRGRLAQQTEESRWKSTSKCV